MFDIWGLAVGLIGGADYQFICKGRIRKNLRARTVNFSADSDLAADGQLILEIKWQIYLQDWPPWDPSKRPHLSS